MLIKTSYQRLLQIDMLISNRDTRIVFQTNLLITFVYNTTN